MDNQHEFDADVIDMVNRDFYVDDLLKSVENTLDAIRMCRKLSDLLSLGGFSGSVTEEQC